MWSALGLITIISCNQFSLTDCKQKGTPKPRPYEDSDRKCFTKDCFMSLRQFNEDQEYEYEAFMEMMDVIEGSDRTPLSTNPGQLLRLQAFPSFELPRDTREIITYDMFKDAAKAYTSTGIWVHAVPTKTQYDEYIQHVASGMSVKEQAMFMANIVWETGGMVHTEEIACKHGGCVYGKYFGRGYIQLTWQENYRNASHDLFGDDRLVQNPGLATASDLAWRIAAWYWKKFVVPSLARNNAVEKYLLGYSVRAINGPLECAAKSAAHNRLAIYNTILRAWKISDQNPGRLTGCLHDHFSQYMRQLLKIFKSRILAKEKERNSRVQLSK